MSVVERSLGIRPRILVWTAAALGCLLAGPRTAAGQAILPDLRHACQDYWMRTRTEILACLMSDYRAADAELNRVYRTRMASLPQAQREALRREQRAWLVRYDRVLTGFYSEPWANHSRVKVLPSQIRALRDRTEYLRRYGR